MKYPRSLPKTPEARAWWEGAYEFFKKNGTKAGYPPFELPSGEKVEIHYSQNKDSVNTDRNTGLKTRPKSQSSKDAAIRNAGLKQQEQEYIDTWLEGGYSQEQAEEALKRHKKNHRGLANQVTALNKEHGSHSFSLGHGTAVKEGGGDFIGNERLEIGKSKDGKRGNFSRSSNDELTDSVKPLIGQPRSGRGGRDSALMDILELENPGSMDTGLNPLDRQKITANPDLANDIMAERQAAMELNPKAKGPNRLAFDVNNGAVKLARRAGVFALPAIATVGLSGQAAKASQEEADADPTNLLKRGIAISDKIGYGADLVETAATPFLATPAAPIAAPVVAISGGVANLSAATSTLLDVPAAIERSKPENVKPIDADAMNQAYRDRKAAGNNIAPEDTTSQTFGKLVSDPLNELEWGWKRLTGQAN